MLGPAFADVEDSLNGYETECGSMEICFSHKESGAILCVGDCDCDCDCDCE